MPFLTWQEVERKVAHQAGAANRSELWDCLYLTRAELDELLAYVQEHAAHDWVYPLVCFAAHTGAHRSEALRARVSDVDLKGRTGSRGTPGSGTAAARRR
jgi:integrase